MTRGSRWRAGAVDPFQTVRADSCIVWLHREELGGHRREAGEHGKRPGHVERIGVGIQQLYLRLPPDVVELVVTDRLRARLRRCARDVTTSAWTCPACSERSYTCSDCEQDRVTADRPSMCAA